MYAEGMDIQLSEVEARVLGSLIEKEITTPDYYPLSLNALVNACNQKNNREPVMNLEEEAVRKALDALQSHRLAGSARGADSRVTKYEHRLQEVFNFTRGETAILCVLLLRGPQTPGELRARSERMFPFAHLDDVQSTMQRLMERDAPLVAVLQRLPGTKESRYMHTLSGQVESVIAGTKIPREEEDGPMARFEEEFEKLRLEVDDVKRQLAELLRRLE